MLREAFVHEGVIRAIEIEQAPVLANEIVEEQLGFAAHVSREIVVEVRIVVRVGMDLVHVLEPEPLRRESRAQGVGSRVGEQATRLLLQHARRRKLPLAGNRRELLIRKGSPQEERETRREVRIRHAIGSTGLRSIGLALEPEDEIRAGQDGFEHRADTPFKPTRLPRPP